MMKRWLLLFGLVLCFSAQGMELRQFDDADKQRRYESLIKELRCLVCQNQSLADSDADLAKDLRDEVYDIIQSGKDEQEAAQFLVDRYGDFVLYRPPLKATTSLLWLGPVALLLVGAAFLLRRSKRRGAGGDQPELTQEERLRLQSLKDKLER
jgi:cytochrome c-type biogenesis protein CcmH